MDLIGHIVKAIDHLFEVVVDLDADMTEMVQHVAHVVFENEGERDRLGVRDGAGAAPVRVRHCGRGGQEVLVQRVPQRDEAAPVALLIAVQFHPLVSVTTWDD